MKKLLYTLIISIISIGITAMVITCKDDPLAVITFLKTVTTDDMQAGEQQIAFSLNNPNAEMVQVSFSISPRTPTASYSADGSPFKALTENLELGAMRAASIRIKGLASSTSYTITVTMATVDNAGNTNATTNNTVIIARTTADMTPPAAKATTDDIVLDEEHIAFSLSNPNPEAVQVDFIRLSPAVSTASYRADGNSFNPLTEAVELDAMGKGHIRIAGLANDTSYTITMTTKDSNDNAHATNTVVTATTLADMTPPAQPVVRDNVQPAGKQITFILSNPNPEEVQVAFSLNPAVSAASYRADGTSFDPTNLMLVPRNAQKIIIGGLTTSTSYTITMTTKDTNGNPHAY